MTYQYVRKFNSTRIYVFEYVNAFFDGLHAEKYVPGANICAFNF